MTDILAIRRDMIAFRTAHARQPVLSHRASNLICQLEHLQAPADAAHERRLRKALARTTREIEQHQVRADGGRPSAPCRDCGKIAPCDNDCPNAGGGK